MEVATLSGVIQAAASVEEEEDENVDAGVMEALAAPLQLLLLLLVEEMPLALLGQEDEDLMHLSISLSV